MAQETRLSVRTFRAVAIVYVIRVLGYRNLSPLIHLKMVFKIPRYLFVEMRAVFADDIVRMTEVDEVVGAL